MREKERGKKKEGWGKEREGGGRRKKEEGGERKRREKKKKERKEVFSGPFGAAPRRGLAEREQSRPTRRSLSEPEADLARSESGKRGREKNEKCKKSSNPKGFIGCADFGHLCIPVIVIGY